MKLKQLLFILLIVFGLQETQAQVNKFVTTSFSVSEKNDKGKWGKWSKPEDVSITITLDQNKNRITVYSQEIQLYKIVKYEDVVENSDDIIYPFSCTDEDGMPFTISIITRKKQDNRKQLYINQKNVIVLYNIMNYDNQVKK